MKVICNDNEYSIEEIAAIRVEKTELEKYGEWGYMNYLRVYMDMDICAAE